MRPVTTLSRREFILDAAAGAVVASLNVRSDASPPTLPYRLDLLRTIPLDVHRVRGICVDSEGCFHLAHAGGLVLLSPTGDRMAQTVTDLPAEAVAIRGDGTRFLATRHHILFLDQRGEVVLDWGGPGREPKDIRFATAVAFGAEGVYVADAGNRRIALYSESGELRGLIEGFHIPSPYFDCGLNERGELVVAHTSNHQIETYTGSGRLEKEWGRYGIDIDAFCGCCNPTHIALLPGGRIATTEKGIPRLKVYEANGSLAAFVSPEELGTKINRSHLEPLGEGEGMGCRDGWPGMPMAVDGAGNLAVVIPNLNQVRVFQLTRA